VEERSESDRVQWHRLRITAAEMDIVEQVDSEAKGGD